MIRAATLLILSALVMTYASGQNPSPAESGISHADHAAVVAERAAAALGGAEALANLTYVQACLRGTTTARLQTPNVVPPLEAGVSRLDLLIDFATGQSFVESYEAEAGNIRHSLTAIGGDQQRIYNLYARSHRPFLAPPSFERDLAGHARRLPQLLVRDALERRSQLRSLGATQFEGRMHDVIAFAMADNVQVSLFVDRASGLVSKIDMPLTDPIAGQSVSEVIFSDYSGTGRGAYPRRITTREAEQVTSQNILSLALDARRAPHPIRREFNRFQSVPPSRPNPERIERLADGIFVFHSVSDPQHNAFVVEFADHVVVVDAPESSEGGERLLRRIGGIIPAKPVRFLALTHHHVDHIGGLRSFVASGATIVATPGIRPVVEALARAPIEDRLAANPVPLRFEAVTGKRAFSDGRRTLELIDIGPHPHAREMLVAYIREEKLLFQSDLFIVASNEAPVGPATPSLRAFARALHTHQLSFERIAGGHGRTATRGEFQQRVDYEHPRALRGLVPDRRSRCPADRIRPKKHLI